MVMGVMVFCSFLLSPNSHVEVGTGRVQKSKRRGVADKAGQGQASRQGRSKSRCRYPPMATAGHSWCLLLGPTQH